MCHQSHNLTNNRANTTTSCLEKSFSYPLISPSSPTLGLFYSLYSCTTTSPYNILCQSQSSPTPHCPPTTTAPKFPWRQSHGSDAARARRPDVSYDRLPSQPLIQQYSGPAVTDWPAVSNTPECIAAVGALLSQHLSIGFGNPSALKYYRGH